MKRNLCDERLEQVSIHVEASIGDGKLTISGQDIGPVVEEIFGDSDYEYFYSFDKANTRKLLEAFKPGAEMKEFLELLAGKFSGPDGCALLREFCSDKDIEYDFFSF